MTERLKRAIQEFIGEAVEMEDRYGLSTRKPARICVAPWWAYKELKAAFVEEKVQKEIGGED